MKRKVYSTSKSYQNYSKEVNGTFRVSVKRENEIKELMLNPSTTDVEKQQLKNELIQGHLKFVIQQANRFAGLGVEIEDLISEGNLGLIKAINTFDWSRDIKFITHAVHQIKADLLNTIYNNSRTIRLPVNISQELHRQIKRLNESNVDLDDEYGNLPYTNDLYHPIDDKGILLDVVTNQNCTPPDEELQQKLVLENVLCRLNEKDKKIVTLLFGLEDKPLEIKEIAEKINVSKETVRLLKLKVTDFILGKGTI